MDVTGGAGKAFEAANGSGAAAGAAELTDIRGRIRGKVELGDVRSVAFAAFLTVLSFALGRVEVAATFFPCGIAFLSAALKRNKLNLYLLFPLFLGGASVWTRDMTAWGDAAATVLCAAVFLLLARRGFSDFARMMICIAVTVVCNIAYYTASHMLYRLDWSLLLLETVVVCGFYYIFHVFFSFTNTKEAFRGSIEGGVVALTGVALLLFCGLFMEADRFSGTAEAGMLLRGAAALAASLPMTADFLCVLLFGYKMGVSAGVTAGATASILLYLCGAMPVSQMIIFLCSGLTAGFFRGLNKYTTATCFAAVCLIFGLACTGALGALPSVPPLLAAGVFVLLPERAVQRVNSLLKRLVHESDAYGIKWEENRLDNVLGVLSGYRECFGALAKLYNIGKDQRSIISHQFKGMQQVVNQMEMDLRTADKGKLACMTTGAESRYELAVGTSGYARSGGVSGDSFVCRELSDGRFVMILSDGMGKGEAAALESSLAVKTLANLIEAGFDVEIALHTLNSILLLKSEEEIFSTVDIGIFDKDSGRLKLYKIGAASTFVKRGDRVDAVKLAALPMGIVDGLKIDFVSLKLSAGDQIIMVSDGVTDSTRHFTEQEKDDGGKWLCETIREIRSRDPNTMADLIVNRAVENYGVHEKDDLTVISAVVRDTSFGCSHRT